jgi:hypothetical protein
VAYKASLKEGSEEYDFLTCTYYFRDKRSKQFILTYDIRFGSVIYIAVKADMIVMICCRVPQRVRPDRLFKVTRGLESINFHY